MRRNRVRSQQKLSRYRDHVAALLHVRTPHTPVVVFTMFEDKLSASLTKVLGIAAVVPKNDGVAKLLGRIEALLDAQDALAMQGH